MWISSRVLKHIGLFGLVLATSSAVSYAGTIQVGAINSASQKTVASKIFRRFETDNPGTKIEFTSLSDNEFKTELPNWLSSSSGKFDLIFWQGGNRLFRFVEQGQITPMNEFIAESQLSGEFTPGSLGAVTYDGSIYAIPLSYYQWGFFYRKSIFAKAGLTQPKTWDEFLKAGRVLSSQGITPIALGNSGKWPGSAWFDYLNLRTNGLEFHSELLQGKHSFFDPRVEEVFSHWKELVDNGFFIRHQDVVDWNEALPFIYHSHAAMILMGNFVTGEISPALKDDFAFMPFPTINSSVALYEDAPLDILMVPRNGNMSPDLKKLLVYMSSAEFQSDYNRELGMISPHKDAVIADDRFIQSGADLLSKASGVAQFFDRDTKAAFVGPALDVFAEFLKSGDIKSAQRKLEALRKNHLTSKL